MRQIYHMYKDVCFADLIEGGKLAPEETPAAKANPNPVPTEDDKTSPMAAPGKK